MNKRAERVPATYGSPFLSRVTIKEEYAQRDAHPFTLPLFAPDFDLSFTTPVTFVVGENGAGKSSLLEALAWRAGFGSQGGSRDHQYAESTDGHTLGRAMTFAWRQRVTNGFFFRAETFYNFSALLESANSSFARYGGAAFNSISHGEAFLALFDNRFEDGLYILDEPEAALSPQRQLAFLRILYTHACSRASQFIIATHSPMLLALPGATILSIDSGSFRQVDYRETEHYRLTRDFLEAPERFFRHLFSEDDGAAAE